MGKLKRPAIKRPAKTLDKALAGDHPFALNRRDKRALAKYAAKKGAGCINHPRRPVRINLDGEDLCQECADAWARAEGASQDG